MIRDWIEENYQNLCNIAKKLTRTLNSSIDAFDATHEILAMMLERACEIDCDNLFGYFKVCVRHYLLGNFDTVEVLLEEDEKIEDQTCVEADPQSLKRDKHSMVDHPEFRLIEFLNIKQTVFTSTLLATVFTFYFILGHSVREICNKLAESRYKVMKFIETIIRKVQYEG